MLLYSQEALCVAYGDDMSSRVQTQKKKKEIEKKKKSWWIWYYSCVKPGQMYIQQGALGVGISHCFGWTKERRRRRSQETWQTDIVYTWCIHQQIYIRNGRHRARRASGHFHRQRRQQQERLCVGVLTIRHWLHPELMWTLWPALRTLKKKKC